LFQCCKHYYENDYRALSSICFILELDCLDKESWLLQTDIVLSDAPAAGSPARALVALELRDGRVAAARFLAVPAPAADTGMQLPAPPPGYSPTDQDYSGIGKVEEPVRECSPLCFAVWAGTVLLLLVLSLLGWFQYSQVSANAKTGAAPVYSV
jgi:hypothetical protein